MDLEQVVADVGSRNTTILSKHSNMMKQISDLQQDILNIPNKFGDRSKQFQADKKIQLEQKIDKLQGKVEKWLKDQQDKVEKWLKDQQESILKRELNQTKKLNEARKGFEQIKAVENEYSEIKGYSETR